MPKTIPSQRSVFSQRRVLSQRNVFLVLTALFAAFASAPAFAQQEVNYGVQPDTDPSFIAKALGYFEPIEKKHNVKIVFREFSYGAPENQAMAAGALQFASAGMGPATIAVSRLPAKLVAINILEQTAILVPTDSSPEVAVRTQGQGRRLPRRGLAAISPAAQGPFEVRPHRPGHQAFQIQRS